MNRAHAQAPHQDCHHTHNHTGSVAELLDLDAEILAEHTASVIASLPLTVDPRQIVDLGAGTGAGSFALLERFPDARVTAVDSSAEHLQRLRTNACARGADDRVHTVQADLDSDTWPDLGTPDLVWAAAFLHHAAHPETLLRTVFDTLTPGGMLAIVEPDGFPRFLPATAPDTRPGVEERAHAATAILQAEHMPHKGADWAAELTAAGFIVEAQYTHNITIAGSANEAIGRYALSGLQHIRDVAAPSLSTEDLGALDELLDITSPHNLLRRDDLTLRTQRTVWAARRP